MEGRRDTRGRRQGTDIAAATTFPSLILARPTRPGDCRDVLPTGEWPDLGLLPEALEYDVALVLMLRKKQRLCFRVGNQRLDSKA